MLKRFVLLAPIAAIITVAIFMSMDKTLRASLPEFVIERGMNEISLLTYEEAVGLLPKTDVCRVYSRCNSPKDQAPPMPNIDPYEFFKVRPLGDPIWWNAEIPEGSIPSCDTSIPDSYLPMEIVAPTYPDEAIKKRLEGWVTVVFDVTEEGATENIRVLESEPGDVFVSSAMAAIGSWVVSRGCLDGKFSGSRDIEERIEFVLE